MKAPFMLVGEEYPVPPGYRDCSECGGAGRTMLPPSQAPYGWKVCAKCWGNPPGEDWSAAAGALIIAWSAALDTVQNRRR